MSVGAVLGVCAGSKGGYGGSLQVSLGAAGVPLGASPAHR